VLYDYLIFTVDYLVILEDLWRSVGNTGMDGVLSYSYHQHSHIPHTDVCLFVFGATALSGPWSHHLRGF